MKARILLLDLFFSLPYFIMAQNLSTQQASSLSLRQKQINNFFGNYSIVSDERSLYIIRITGVDEEDYINFYGFSLSWYHANKHAKFWGLTFNAGLGNPPVQGKANNEISLNGINISLIVTGVTGTINGFSFGGFWGNSAKEVNGIVTGILGTDSEHLNGFALGGLMSFSQYSNAIQVAGICNGYCNFNGIGIALINTSLSGFKKLMNRYASDYCDENNMYGIILGLYNAVDVKGLSLALVNNGNSCLQIGLLNFGDSIVQIGLVNLHADGRMGIPIINVNF
jgi:hypothetical protein